MCKAYGVFKEGVTSACASDIGLLDCELCRTVYTAMTIFRINRMGLDGMVSPYLIPEIHFQELRVPSTPAKIQ